MSVIDRTRSVAADRVGKSLRSSVADGPLGALGTVGLGAAAEAIRKGDIKAALAVLPDLKKNALDLGLGVMSGRQSASDAAKALKKSPQIKGKAPPWMKPAEEKPVQKAPAWPGPAVKGDQAPVFGALTSMEAYRELSMKAAASGKSWKNLFFLRITEATPSKSSPAGPEGFNLFAVDVSFAAHSLAGEVVSFGAANMDRMTGRERVEMRVTTLDDKEGNLKRWFDAKCDQAAHTDGTFGLPRDYIVTIELTQMATDAPLKADPRYQQRWRMRPAAREVDLSRRAPELEELTMTFAEFDSFLPAQ